MTEVPAHPVPLWRYVIFVGLAVLGCGADLATKSWAFDRIEYDPANPSKVIWLWEGILSLETHLNEGALFGVGQGRGLLFCGLSFVAAVGIVYWLFVLRAAHDRILTVALGAITAGIFGNLYDRLGLPGLTWNYGGNHHQAGERVFAVRDWIHFQTPWFDWPIFNIADSLLVGGAGLLLYHAFRAPRVAKSESQPVAAAG